MFLCAPGTTFTRNFGILHSNYIVFTSIKLSQSRNKHELSLLAKYILEATNRTSNLIVIDCRILHKCVLCSMSCYGQ